MNPQEDNPYRAPGSDINEPRDLLSSVDVDLWRDHVVSIWVGDFPTLDEADSYFEVTFHDDQTPISDFAAEFGFRGYRDDCLDVHYDEAPQPVHELLKRCAYSELFAPAVVEAAARAGIAEVSWLVALYHHDWLLAGSSRTQGRHLRFLGVYPCGTPTGVAWLDRITARTDYPAGAFLAVLEVVRELAASGSEEPLQAADLCQGLYEHFVAKYGDDARQQLEELALVSSEALANVVGGLMAERVEPSLGEFAPEELHGLFTIDDWFPAEEGEDSDL